MGKICETFGPRQTRVVKGTLIIILLWHHLFANNTVQEYSLQTIIGNVELHKYLAAFGKVCVGGFAFLSAYGNAKKFSGVRESVARWIKLEASFLAIFISALLWKVFVMKESLAVLYVDENGIFCPIYILIDGLGLASFFGVPTLNVTWWYMTAALEIIVCVPILVVLYRKIGKIILLPALIVPFVVFRADNHFGYLLATIVFGVAFAEDGILERIKKTGAEKKHKKLLHLFLYVVILYLLYGVCVSVENMAYGYLPCGIVITLFCFEFLEDIPVVSHILAFLGKHSANIFFVHTFIYYYFYKEFIYSFKYDILIAIVLLITSLLVSVVIEFVKKVFRYNKAVALITEKIEEYSEKK